MANVLGELFGAIASSIRGGLGEIGTMKPSAFPARIDDIVALLESGGSGTGGTGGSTEQLKFATGSLRANENGTSVFVEHGLGVKPDFVLVQYASIYAGETSEFVEEYPTVCTWAISSAFDTSKKSGVIMAGMGSVSTTGLDVYSTTNGSIYCPDTARFRIYQKGTGNNGQLTSNGSYSWLAISGIGSASSADVRYVTFMSHDGTVEYGKKAVAVGDDCADPIARGVFTTPTRESDVQYNYTFYGWATEVNGAADSDALKAVTEDRTVYANYAGVLRQYTARFYDGETLMGSPQTVTYGSKATPPDVTKIGYTFDGWTPADLTIYGDTDFVGSWSELTGLYSIMSIDVANPVDVTISRDATRLALVRDNYNTTAPTVYNIESTTPKEVNILQLGGNEYHNGCAYNYNDDRLLVKTTAKNVHVRTFSTNTVGSYSTDASVKLVRCSPVADICAHVTGAYNAYVLSMKDLTDSFASLAKTPTGKFVSSCSDFAFSPDGNYIAGASTYNTDGVSIFKVSDGSSVIKLTTNATKKVSWSGDSSKIALSYSSSPYVEIYNTSTWTKICDLSDQMTSAGYAEFMGESSILVVGFGTTVKAFDFSGNTPQVVENIPKYSGNNVAGIRSNFSGTRLAIMTSDAIHVWGKTG